MQNTLKRECGQFALKLGWNLRFSSCFFNEWCKRTEFCNMQIVICGYDVWAEGHQSHLQHNMAKSNLYSCKSIMPKNVLASLALQNLMMFSHLLYSEYESKMAKITLAHLTADPQTFPCCVHPWVIGVWPIRCCNLCFSEKSDYYTVDSSGWICVRLATVSSNPDSLNQNKHLGSIIPCWKPLIENWQTNLKKSRTKLWTLY